MKPELCIIVAIAEDRAIGKDNKMLWHIPEDFKRFRELTIPHPLIMGRKTFDSIGKPLPERTNIVITRDNSFHVPGCERAISLEEAISIAQKKDQQRAFVIGGGQIYQQALSLASRLYLTIVEGKFEADTYLPEYSDFSKIISDQPRESNGYKYRFLELER